MTQALKKTADSASDPQARNLVPKVTSRKGPLLINLEEGLEKTRVTIDQMVTYLTTKAFPMLVDLTGSLSELGMIRLDEPIKNCHLFLKF